MPLHGTELPNVYRANHSPYRVVSRRARGGAPVAPLVLMEWVIVEQPCDPREARSGRFRQKSHTTLTKLRALSPSE